MTTSTIAIRSSRRDSCWVRTTKHCWARKVFCPMDWTRCMSVIRPWSCCLSSPSPPRASRTRWPILSSRWERKTYRTRRPLLPLTSAAAVSPTTGKTATPKRFSPRAVKDLRRAQPAGSRYGPRLRRSLPLVYMLVRRSETPCEAESTLLFQLTWWVPIPATVWR